jgi:hypothetical protein
LQFFRNPQDPDSGTLKKATTYRQQLAMDNKFIILALMGIPVAISYLKEPT